MERVAWGGGENHSVVVVEAMGVSVVHSSTSLVWGENLVRSVSCGGEIAGSNGAR